MSTGPVHAVDQDRDTERQERRALAPGVFPEAADRLGALAERVVVRRAGVPAVAQARDPAVGALAGAADVERRARLLQRQRRGDDVVHAMALGLDLRALLRPQRAHQLERLVAAART